MIVSIFLVPAVAYLFYDSWIGIIPGMITGLLYYLEWKKEKEKKDKRKLLIEFKALMNALDAALEGGYSLENAVGLAEKDLENEYGRKSRMRDYLRVINRRLSLNEPIDRCFMDVAEESGLEEIREFANVIHILKYTGGNTIRIIRDSVRTISERIDVENDILAIISGKKLEQKIMVLMPFIIILYTRISMGSFMQALYTDLLGRLFMTVMLIMVIIADRVGKHITDINV